MTPHHHIPFPGVGSWVFVVLAFEDREQLAWVPRNPSLEAGSLLELDDENEWTVCYVSDTHLELSGEEGSIAIH